MKAYDRLLEAVPNHELAKARKEILANGAERGAWPDYLMPKLCIIDGVSTQMPENADSAKKIKLPELKTTTVPQAQPFSATPNIGKVPPGM